MNLSTLLALRDHLNEQARLANTAYAYATLKRFAHVIRRANLAGRVLLQQPNEQEERYWAALTPLEGSPAVIEEHFSDDDVTALADAVGYATGSPCLDLQFRIERLEEQFVPALATALQMAGVHVDGADVQPVSGESEIDEPLAE